LAGSAPAVVSQMQNMLKQAEFTEEANIAIDAKIGEKDIRKRDGQ
jgi:hypothetical protein